METRIQRENVTVQRSLPVLLTSQRNKNLQNPALLLSRNSWGFPKNPTQNRAVYSWKFLSCTPFPNLVGSAFFVEPKQLNMITWLPQCRDGGLCQNHLWRVCAPFSGVILLQQIGKEANKGPKSVVSSHISVMWLFGWGFSARKHLIRSNRRRELTLQWFNGKTN